jgi:uncharacterized SAM-binding protein YcdF (DUF218 family)
MFVFISKLAWLLFAPLNFLLIVIALGLAIWRWPRRGHWGRRMVVCGVLSLIALAVLPIGPWTLHSLERRFPPYQPCTSGPPVAGVILLGGGLQAVTVDGRIVEALNDGADRIRYAAQLAHDNPGVPLLVSGGQVFDRPGARSEAEMMADMLVELGVERSRIRTEDASRTTAENADMTSAAAQSEPGVWLLVTSAWHMPRAIGLFRNSGVKVRAAPTDWHVDDAKPFVLMTASNNITQFELAMKEYTGLIAFRMMGRTDALIPGPKGDACAAT